MPIGAVNLLLVAVLVTGAGAGVAAVAHVMGPTSTCATPDAKVTQSVHVLDDQNTTNNTTEIEDLNETQDSGSGDQSGCGPTSEGDNSTASLDVRVL